MFTWRHLLWLVICAGIVSVVMYAYNKRRPNLERVITVALYIAIASELSEIFSIIELVPSRNGELMLPYLPLNHFPLHMCSMQIILIAVAKFMKNEKRREHLLAFMAPTCVFGGFFAMLLPSIFSTTIPVERCFTSIIGYQFFLYHTMLIILGLIIVRSGRVAWSMKHYRNTLLMVYLMGVISLFLNSMFASPTYVDGKLVSVDFWTNFFFTYQNPLGIHITQLWQWYLYILVLYALVAFLLFMFYLPLIRRNRKQ